MAKEKSEKDAKGKDAKHDKGGKPAGKPPAADAKPAAKPAKDAKKEGKAAKPTAKEAAPTQPPRLQVQYREHDRAGAHEAVRLQDAHAGAARHQDHAQHGRGRGRGRQEDPRERLGRPAEDRRARSRWSRSRASPSPPSRSARAIRSAAW
jgi:hypothetical protein